MKKLILMVLFGTFFCSSLFAFKSGIASFCAMDNYGNLYCYYYDYNSCYNALKYNQSYVACVLNQ